MEGFKTEIYAARVIGDKPQDFTSVEINGVRYCDEAVNGRTPAIREVQIDNERFDFISAYVRHKDGRLLAVADFGTHAEALAYAKGLSARYGWELICPTGFQPSGITAA